jgi:hypothetical protein
LRIFLLLSGGGSFFGGAIGATSLDLEHSTFTNNGITTVVAAQALQGGAVSVNAAITITNCSFTSNYLWAPVVAATSPSEINSCTTDCVF